MEKRTTEFFKNRIGQVILESTLLHFGYKVERIGCEISPFTNTEDADISDYLPDLLVTEPEGDKKTYLEVKLYASHPLEVLIEKSRVDMLKKRYPGTVLVFISAYNGSVNCIDIDNPVISGKTLNEEGMYRVDLLSDDWKPLWDFFPLVEKGEKTDALWQEIKSVLGDFAANRLTTSRDTGFFVEEKENLKKYIEKHWHPGMLVQDISMLNVEYADIADIWEHAMNIHAFRFAFDLCGGEANMDHPAFSQVMDKLLGRIGERFVTIPYQEIKEALGTHPELYARLQALEDEVSRTSPYDAAFVLMDGLLEIIPPGIGIAYVVPEKGTQEDMIEIDYYTVLRLLQRRNCLYD
ncbi:MAG: hypothetical protein JW712_11495 [Dehalococcoidales bacterium]|nr:hypothetical protein [Dehalococcoidales bacterium]